MAQEEVTRIVVQVQPKAAQNRVLGFRDGVWHIRVAAPPVEGKANQELLKFLGDVLGIAKSNLTLEKGAASKRKVVAATRLTQDQVVTRLEKRVNSDEKRTRQIPKNR